jgi:hypothetical protein
MEIKTLPPILNVLPKEIQEEFLYELNRSEQNLYRWKCYPINTLFNCINCVEWDNTVKGHDYWHAVARGEYTVPFYEKYLSLG